MIRCIRHQPETVSTLLVAGRGQVYLILIIEVYM